MQGEAPQDKTRPCAKPGLALGHHHPGPNSLHGSVGGMVEKRPEDGRWAHLCTVLSLPAGLWLHQDTVGPGYYGLCPPFGKGRPVPPWGLQVWGHPLSLSCRLSLRGSLSPRLSTELAAGEAAWLLLAPQHLQQKAAAPVFIWDRVHSPWARNPP